MPELDEKRQRGERFIWRPGEYTITPPTGKPPVPGVREESARPRPRPGQDAPIPTRHAPSRRA